MQKGSEELALNNKKITKKKKIRAITQVNLKSSKETA